MPRRTLTPAPTAALAVLASIALALLTLGGCGNGKKKVLDPHGLHPPGMSNYQGFFASEGGVGRIGVVTSAPTASGALTLEGGGSISLVGTYDNASDSLHLTGSGYDFGGRVSPVSGLLAIAGNFTSPGADGAFAVALVNSFGPHQYCGRLYGAGNSLVGRVAYVVSGIAILGAACFEAEPTPVALVGELDRSSPKPRLSMAGTSATRDVTLHGAYDEDADLSAGSWTSTGTAADASGTWGVAPCP